MPLNILARIASFVSYALMFGVILSPLTNVYWTEIYNISLIYLAAAAIRFATMVVDDRKGGVSYMFEFFMLFFIALPAHVQIDARVFPFYANLQPAYMVSAYSIIAISHVSFNLAWSYWMTRRRAGAKLRPDKSGLSFREERFYLGWAVGFAVLSIAMAGVAGPSNLLVARLGGGVADFGGLTQQFLFMCRSISLLAIIILLYLILHGKSVKIRRFTMIALLLFVAPFLVINYLPALPRFVLFGIFLAISTAFVNYFSPVTKTIVMVASIFGLFVFFPFIKSLATGQVYWADLFLRADFDSISYYLLRVDFDGFMQITSTIEFLDQSLGSIRYGNNFLGVLLFFVPRGLWPGKPIDTGEIVSTGLNFFYTNVSSPLPAEALMGFGLIGPVLVFGLLAIAVVKIERLAVVAKGAVPAASSFFLHAIAMGFITIIMRGALNGVAPQFATAFLAFFIMEAARKRRTRRTKPSQILQAVRPSSG